MAVALGRISFGRGAGHGRRTRRHDHGSLCRVISDGVINPITARGIVSASGRSSFSRSSWTAAKPLQAGPPRAAGGLVEGGGDPVEKDLRIGRQIEVAIRLDPAFLPASVVVDQVLERDMVAAFRQEQVAGPERVANRQGQGDLPDPPVDPAVFDEEGRPERSHRNHPSRRPRACRHRGPAGW
jgi:hypothetical protein